MRRLMLLLFFMAGGLISLWAADPLPFGTFIVSKCGRLETSGRITLLDDSPYVGSLVEVKPDYVIFQNHIITIRRIVRLQYTEDDFMKTSGGSGQGAMTFADIGFSGTILYEFYIRYTDLSVLGNNDLRDLFKGILVISDKEYVFEGTYFFFCEKVEDYPYEGPEIEDSELF